MHFEAKLESLHTYTGQRERGREFQVGLEEKKKNWFYFSCLMLGIDRSVVADWRDLLSDRSSIALTHDRASIVLIHLIGQGCEDIRSTGWPSYNQCKLEPAASLTSRRGVLQDSLYSWGRQYQFIVLRSQNGGFISQSWQHKCGYKVFGGGNCLKGSDIVDSAKFVEGGLADFISVRFMRRWWLVNNTKGSERAKIL